MKRHFNLCIVGAGMVGSAAARHAMQHLTRGGEDSTSTTVCCVGPSLNGVGTCRGAHFDVARITRRLEATAAVWGHLADRSIAQYPELEALSCIPFYDPRGMLWITPHTNSEAAKKLRTIGAEVSANSPTLRGRPIWTEVVGAEAIRYTFPPISAHHFCDTNAHDVCAFVERPRSGGGLVNPSAFVNAELTVAQGLGCRWIKEVATKIVSSGAAYTVKCLNGTTETEIGCDQIIVAAGTLTKFHDFLPKQVVYSVIPEMVVLLEVHPEDLPQVIRMPSVIQSAGVVDERFYMLPPQKYTEFGGGYFIKAGPTTYGRSDAPLPSGLQTLQESLDWYDGKTPNSELEATLEASIRRFYPKIRFISKKLVYCCFDETPGGMPYIGPLEGTDGKMHLFIGGNGKAAKSCDEIGRLLALQTLTGKWPRDAPIRPSDCAIRYV